MASGIHNAHLSLPWSRILAVSVVLMKDAQAKGYRYERMGLRVEGSGLCL